MTTEEVMRLWVQALRSGEYIQGKGFLNQEGKYCCLGVLCELAIKNGVNITEQVTLDCHRILYGGYAEELPVEVMSWARLKHPCVMTAVRKENKVYRSLSLANDAGISFMDIADHIENNWMQFTMR